MSDHQVNLTRLRERAERAIAREEASLARDGGASTGLESRQLVEDLRVYQTELEIQNEELNQAQSQLAQTLERYRLLFEHLPLPALVVDDRGFILEINRHASDVLNLDRPSVQQRGALFQLFDFASRAPLHAYFRGLAPPGPLILTELRARLAEDQTLPCDLHLMPLAAKPLQGRQTLAVLVDRGKELALRDSERRWRALSEDFQLAKREAESANQAKSAFLATMSHEFRTPMNAILGLTDLLLSSEPTPGRGNYLRKIHDVAGALYGLLNDILDYSRVETGLLTLQAQPLRLDDILDSTCQLFQLRAEEKALDLRCEVAPDVPPLVLGDPLRLQQVLNHLVDNALKFTAAGSVQVLIARADPPESKTQETKCGKAATAEVIPGKAITGEVLSGGAITGDATSGNATSPAALTGGANPDMILRLSVTDTGIGLTPFEQGRLFLPFQQGDMSNTRPYGGAGLGLAISQRLVRLMGGELGVESVKGAGSTFWFTVPLGLSARSGTSLEAAADPNTRETPEARSSSPPTGASAPVPASAAGISPLQPGVALATGADPWPHTPGVTPAREGDTTPPAPPIGMGAMGKTANESVRAAAATTLDSALLEAKFATLARLLDEGSNQARYLSRELEGLLASLDLRDAYAEIATAIGALDYPAALAALRRLAQRQGWPLP